MMMKRDDDDGGRDDDDGKYDDNDDYEDHDCSARDWDGKDYLRIIPRVVW
jgi:hypothetical protein